MFSVFPFDQCWDQVTSLFQLTSSLLRTFLQEALRAASVIGPIFEGVKYVESLFLQLFVHKAAAQFQYAIPFSCLLFPVEVEDPLDAVADSPLMAAILENFVRRWQNSLQSRTI